MEHLGKTLIIIGIRLVIAGLMIYFFGNKFNWLGHLPGRHKYCKGECEDLHPFNKHDNY
jgi:hypothetical protein